MRNQLFTGVAVVALLGSGNAAFAQSTGSIDFGEEDLIVVTGTRSDEVGGIIAPDTPKAKAVLTDEIIQRQQPGQTINEIINLIPGVSFQNNDPYGSSGGTLTIRGFDSTRISQTFDGVPLNDSGNYAIYSNQQLDPELIEQVNVNLGTTDVDSPTASAVGGTVNYRTRIPGDDIGAKLVASYGEYDFHRIFGMIDTGEFTPWGTKAFVAASYTTNSNPFNDYGRIRKQQYNARIYQPLGADGDFLSLSGHYNQNRSNFGGSVGLRNDMDPPDGFPSTKDERFYDIGYPCTIPATQLGGGQGQGRPGVADTYSDFNGCGALFDRRYNPSNTGNIRGSSLFTLADGLVLSVDPSYQYVKANGGGPEDLREQSRTIGGVAYTGFIGGAYLYGRDLNGDGDLLDRVAGNDPSQTQTHRYVVISSLAYELNDEHRVRVAYTFDRARHRQTGQTGFQFVNGEPFDVFPINDPILTSDGFALNKRDRLSYAILHQVSGEYRGEFGPATVLIGLRAPFFTRDLNQNCYTTSASGFVDCLGDQDPTAYETANPNAAPPQSRTYKYDKLLPNIGLTFDVTESLSVFGNYAKGLSVPGTDPLYDSLFVADLRESQPVPETTDSFDVGARFRSGRLQAQVAAWYTNYANRLASSYDPILDETIFRNLGEVEKYGFDGSIAYEPVDDLLLYVFGSYLKSKIKDDVQVDTVGGVPVFAETAGNRESGSPVYTLGARVQGTIGPVELGAQVKRTGKRFINDENLPVERGGDIVFGATAPAYTTVDLDARFSLAQFGLEETYFQLNVSNLFDELYVGGFGGGLERDQLPFVQIGSPRAVSGSIVIGF